MAANTRKAKGPAQRKSVNRAAEGSGTRTVKGRGPVDEQEQQEEAQEYATRTQKVHVIAQSSFFQLRAEKEAIHGVRDAIAPMGLRFINNSIALDPDDPDDAEKIEAVKQVIEGEWKDGRVSGKRFAELARDARLQIVYPGLAKRPMKTWDDPSLGADLVRIALAAGVLSTPKDIDDAIAYEVQAPKRQPKRETRQWIVDQLQALRAALSGEAAAVPTPGEAAKSVSPATGASAVPADTQPEAPSSSEDTKAREAVAGGAPGLTPKSEEN